MRQRINIIELLAKVSKVDEAQARCPADTARRRMAEIDQRKTKRLKIQAERISTRRRKTVTEPSVAEVYSPPRLTKIAQEHGLHALWALDLTGHDPDDGLPWDFRDPAKREKVMLMLKRDRPGLIILGPPCSCFSAIQWFYNYDHCSVASARAKIGEGMEHLAFAVRLCHEQLKAGRHFVLEHPVAARSWSLQTMRWLERKEGVKKITFVFLRVGDGRRRSKRSCPDPEADLHPHIIRRDCQRNGGASMRGDT